MSWIKLNKDIVVLAVLAVVLGGMVFNNSLIKSENISGSNVVTVNDADVENLVDDDIFNDEDYAEEHEAFRNSLPELTEEQAYQNSFIRHIRIFLDGYLRGDNEGIEEDAISGKLMKGSEQCGLANFDRNLYKSKFFLFSAEPGMLGGWVADIVFVDKPDTLFFAWIYGHPEVGDPYLFRAFCKSGPPVDKQDDFIKLMEEFMKDLKYSM